MARRPVLQKLGGSGWFSIATAIAYRKESGSTLIQGSLALAQGADSALLAAADVHDRDQGVLLVVKARRAGQPLLQSTVAPRSDDQGPPSHKVSLHEALHVAKQQRGGSLNGTVRNLCFWGFVDCRVTVKPDDELRQCCGSPRRADALYGGRPNLPPLIRMRAPPVAEIRRRGDCFPASS